MPAVTVDNPLALPRPPRLSPEASVPRPVELIVTAHKQVEGAGISIRRPFPGEFPLAAVDPFLLLDQAGPMVNGPEVAWRSAALERARAAGELAPAAFRLQAAAAALNEIEDVAV